MGMKKDKFFLKNSELSVEFSKYVIEHPEFDEFLTEEAVVIFIPEYDPELKDYNMKIAKDIESEGGKVVYIKVKQLSPKITSRLVGVEVNTH
ncbi:conserved hypothetical protein [Candidatus Brocadia pituitae]|nr:conserved hypothetical protein [Candidatus Brocadia pituitae]